MPPSPTAIVTPRVAAIVPHWNRRDLLAPLLENLSRQTRPFDEIIVVDNGSSDGSADLARETGVRVVALDRNLGFAAAVNRGIAAARENVQLEWIAILNNDVTLVHPTGSRSFSRHTRGRDVSFATGKNSVRTESLHSSTAPSTSFRAEPARHAAAPACPMRPFGTCLASIRFAPMTAALFRAHPLPEDRRSGRNLRLLPGGCRIRVALCPRAVCRARTCPPRSPIIKAVRRWVSGARNLCGGFRATSFSWPRNTLRGSRFFR